MRISIHNEREKRYKWSTTGALAREKNPQIQKLRVENDRNEKEASLQKISNKKSSQVIDAASARTVNELARAKFKQKILNDILVDLMICEIEGWCKSEYIQELKNLINGICKRDSIIYEAA